MGILSRVYDLKRAVAGCATKPDGSPCADEAFRDMVLEALVDPCPEPDQSDPHHLSLKIVFEFGFSPGEAAAVFQCFRRIVKDADSTWFGYVGNDGCCYQGSGVQEAELQIYQECDTVAKIDLMTLVSETLGDLVIKKELL